MAGKDDFSLASTVQLNNGIQMPRIQLGVYMVSGQATIDQAVHTALDAGYRAVDSAAMYYNEAESGRAILSWLGRHPEVKREEIFFTTKLKENSSYNGAREAIEQSIEKCGLGYVDLYLLHSPYGGKEKRRECWRAVEDAILEGKVRAGGVSNFGVKHMEQLLEDNLRIVPAINQIEVHPFNTQRSLALFCQQKGVVVQAWGPLSRGYKLKDRTVTEVAKKYECSPAQLMLRWGLQHDYVVLPKSVKPTRVVENGQVNGFEISEEDMEVMDGLDEHLVTDWDPTDCL